MKKDLLLFEINECSFKFFIYGSKKYNFPKIYEFLKKNEIKIITQDKKEGLNLDPWVQWVSVHTGVPSSQHKVFRMGQVLSKGISQIWDVLQKKKITVLLWGLFNSNLRNTENINLFYPDPWSFTQKAYPREFNSFLILPRYYGKNYPNVSIFKLLIYTIIFFRKIIFSKIFFYLFKNSLNFIKILFITKAKSFNLYFLLDLLSLLIVCKQIKKKKSDLAIISLNAFAHYQHNYWDEKKYEFYYFWYLNKIVEQCQIIEKNYNSVIIFNGFSQKKIKPLYYLRPKNIKNFLDMLNINFLKAEQNMTTGVTVFFDKKVDKNNAICILKSISFFNQSLFEVLDYPETNKIFYKFNCVFYRKAESIKNFKKSSFKIINKIRVLPNNLNNSFIIEKIFNNVIYIKSTSKHVSSGNLYYKNLDFKPYNKKKNNYFPNHQLNKIIINHFS